MTANSKILIIGPSWLGDMIMAQSLFKKLYKQGKVIDVVAPKWNHKILSCMPEVNKAIEMPFNHGDLKLIARYKFAQELKEYNYDECIVIPNSFKSALIPYWAGIKKRTGWLGEQRFFLLNNHKKLNSSQYPLMVQRLVALADFTDLTTSTGYEFPQLNIDSKDIQSTMFRHGLNYGRKILILAPGAAYGDTKKWPAEYFAKIAEAKLEQGWQVWLLGSINDYNSAEIVNSHTNNKCINLAGKLQLDETVALIAIANIIVSNDSGLLHVAAAVNTPLVGIYGSTSPDFTPPLIMDNKKAILKVKNLSCSPCFKQTCKYRHLKCLYDLKPELVITVINNLVPE